MLRTACVFGFYFLVFQAADAAVISTDGASKLKANGTAYNVSFQNGSCSSLYNGCDDPSDFVFNNPGEALSAGTALLDLINSRPALQSNPNFNGCDTNATTEKICLIYSYFIPSSVGDDIVINSNFGDPRLVNSVDLGKIPLGDPSTVLDPTATVAVWTLAAVPLPASLPLAAAGLAGLGLIGRQRRRTSVARGSQD